MRPVWSRALAKRVAQRSRFLINTANGSRWRRGCDFGGPDGHVDDWKAFVQSTFGGWCCRSGLPGKYAPSGALRADWPTGVSSLGPMSRFPGYLRRDCRQCCRTPGLPSPSLSPPPDAETARSSLPAYDPAAGRSPGSSAAIPMPSSP